ncbi:hypothetical protein Tco_0479223 [Tanacetum coccineum]
MIFQAGDFHPDALTKSAQKVKFLIKSVTSQDVETTSKFPTNTVRIKQRRRHQDLRRHQNSRLKEVLRRFDGLTASQSLNELTGFLDSGGGGGKKKQSNNNVSFGRGWILSNWYANVSSKPSRTKVNFRILFTPAGNGIDLVVPVESIRAISERFANTAYGFFLARLPGYSLFDLALWMVKFSINLTNIEFVYRREERKDGRGV